MPVNLSIKNAPDQVVQRLRERAERHHRSLQGELLAIIEAAVEEERPATPADILARAEGHTARALTFDVPHGLARSNVITFTVANGAPSVVVNGIRSPASASAGAKRGAGQPTSADAA
jgi:plasmid stability protein